MHSFMLLKLDTNVEMQIIYSLATLWLRVLTQRKAAPPSPDGLGVDAMFPNPSLGSNIGGSRGVFPAKLAIIDAETFTMESLHRRHTRLNL